MYMPPCRRPLCVENGACCLWSNCAVPLAAATCCDCGPLAAATE